MSSSTLHVRHTMYTNLDNTFRDWKLILLGSKYYWAYTVKLLVVYWSFTVPYIVHIHVWNTVATAKNHWLISWALPLNECFYPLSPGHSGQRIRSIGQTTGQWLATSSSLFIYRQLLFSSLFIHRQLDAFSAACPSLTTALLRVPALIPCLLSILHSI